MLDGFFLSYLVDELKTKINNSYVDKIYQPTKNELIFNFRLFNNSYKLLLNINSSQARVCLTEQKIENPNIPPMFCMLIRKYLNGSKLINIYQYNFERIVFFEFENKNEIGDKIFVKLIIEIMGRHSNIILVDQDNFIIDSIKRVSSSISRVRQILPKLKYTLPPSQNKKNILEHDLDNIIKNILLNKDLNLSQSLISSIEGLSPSLANQISFKILLDNNNLKIKDLDINNLFLEKLKLELSNLKNILKNKTGKPIIFLDLDDNPKDFYFININQDFKSKELKSFNNLVDFFYEKKYYIDRASQRAKEILSILNNLLKKLNNKLEIQKKEKEYCKNKEKIQQKAILLQSNLYLINKNQDYIILDNFFDNNNKIKIDLDKKISAPANAERYFNQYKKLCVKDKMLDDLIISTQNEIIYIESVIDNIIRSNSQQNLDEIKLELQQEGYLKKSKDKKDKKLKIKNKKPLDMIFKTKSQDGTDILVGNNNINNDWLTFKYANKNDIWLHTQKIPGAHVIIKSGGKEIIKDTLEQAARLAVQNSKAKDNSSVLVDFTLVKNVRKYKGAKPGMVLYENFKTIIIK